MIELLHDSVDISNLVISYTRQQEMCTGIGILDVVLVDEGRAYFPWDVLELSEDGTKKGEYYIVEFDDDENSGTMSVSAQDGSKRLTDYFIEDQYEVSEATTTRSLIIKFLNQAGVSYSITDDEGEELGVGATFGMGSAYDTIVTLLQSSGWYMYFNSVNTCIIGTLDTNPGSADELTDTTISYIKVHKDDNMLRNKAVVWGGSEYPSGGMVAVTKETITPWNYDENDLRAVVISNGNIREYSIANEMANKLMQEFARITIEKEINLVGPVELSIGDYVAISSNWWNGSGLITTYGTSFSEGDGLQTNIILDQRCPRLFGFWKQYPLPPIEPPPPPEEVFDYVYVGTWGDGIWRKPINDVTWEDYSNGLALERSVFIKDLFIKDGMAVCVADDGYGYMRKETDDIWRQINHGGFQNGDFYHYMPEMQAIACSISDSGTIILGVNYTPELTDDLEVTGDKFSFVIGISPTSDPLAPTIVYQDKVVYTLEIEGEDPVEVTNVNINDLEAMGSSVIVSTIGYAPADAYHKDHKSPSYASSSYPESLWGQEVEATNTFGPDGQYELGPTGYTWGFYNDSTIVTDDEDHNIFYGFRVEYFFVANLGEKTIVTYPWSAPSEWDDLTTASFGLLRQKSATEFDIIAIIDSTDGFHNDSTHIYHTHYTLGDELLLDTTLIKTWTGNPGLGEHPGEPYGVAILGNKFICDCPTPTCPERTACQSVFMYDLDTGANEIFTNQIATHVWDDYSWEEEDPVGWVEIYQRYTYAQHLMIPGVDSVTFGRIYTIATSWSYDPVYLFPVFYGYNLIMQTLETRGAYIKFSKDADGSVSIEQEIEKTLTTHENTPPNINWKDDAILDIVGSTTFVNTSNMVANGGCIYQVDFTQTPGYAQETRQGIVVSLDDTLNVINQYITPEQELGVEFYDDKLLKVIYGDLYHISFGSNYGSGVSSKYFTSKFNKRMGYGAEEYILIQDLNLDTVRVPTEGTTTFGTAYYNLWHFTINDDDNDGTIYYHALRTEDDEDLILGIRTEGTSYSINKEFSVPYLAAMPSTGIFGNWAYSVAGTYTRMVNNFSGGSPSKVLLYAPPTYTVLLDTGYSSAIEINKGSPIEAYHKVPQLATSSAFIYQNNIASTEGWSTITPLNPIYDLRVCDIISPDNFSIEEGTVGDELKWVMTGTDNGLKMFPVSLAGESVLVTSFEDNKVTNLETTNFNGNPYLFVTLSGVYGSGAGFYQRGQNELAFEEYSSGLPSSAVTIIRVDDRI